MNWEEAAVHLTVVRERVCTCAEDVPSCKWEQSVFNADREEEAWNLCDGCVELIPLQKYIMEKKDEEMEMRLRQEESRWRSGG